MPKKVIKQRNIVRLRTLQRKHKISNPILLSNVKNEKRIPNKNINDSKYKIISILFISNTLPSYYTLKVPLHHPFNGHCRLYLPKGYTEVTILQQYHLLDKDDCEILNISFKRELPTAVKINRVPRTLNYVSTKESKKDRDKNKRNKILYHVIVLRRGNFKNIKIVYPLKNTKLYSTRREFEAFYALLETKILMRFPEWSILTMGTSENYKSLIDSYKGRTFFYHKLYKQENTTKKESIIVDRLICIKNKVTGEVKRVSLLDYNANIYDTKEWVPTTKSFYKRTLMYEYRSKNKGVAFNQEDFNKKYRTKAAEEAAKPRGPNTFPPKYSPAVLCQYRNKSKSPLKRRRIRINKRHDNK